MNRYLSALLVLSITQTAHAQSDGAIVSGKDRVQAYIGVMEIDDQTGELQNEMGDPATGEPVDIDFANLIAIGIEAETPLRSRDSGLELGVNAGVGISWRGSDTEFAGKVDEGGGTVAFRIDNEMLILEGHIGGYLRAHLGKSADFYLGAGPAIIFAEHDVDDDDTDAENLPETGGSTIVLGDDSSSDIILGYYARAGIEFDLGAGKQWGLGVRYLGGELDFNDTVGEFDLEGVQVLLTYSAWF
jgi:hypothetical protein